MTELEKCPKEILEKIFEYSHIRDLLNLTLTCKKFNDIISNNKGLLKRFEVKIKRNVENETPWTGTRKYSRLLMTRKHPEIPKIIETNNITELVLVTCRIDGIDLKKILLTCKKLVKLYITNAFCYYNDECFNEPMPRLMLNELRCTSNRTILNILAQCHTKMYENACMRIHHGELDAFRNFLKNQKHLEDLQFYSFKEECEIFNHDTLNVVDFRLKELRVNGFGNYSIDNFRLFLGNHRESLVHFEIGQKSRDDSDVPKQVEVVNCITDFRNLKSLFLRRISFSFEPLLHVEKLKLLGYNLHGADQNWSEKFPNVNHLILSRCTSLKEVEKLTKLETLELEQMEKFQDLDIPPTLKHLRLFYTTVNGTYSYDFENGQLETLKVEHCVMAEWLVDFLSKLKKKLKLLKVFKSSFGCYRSFATQSTLRYKAAEHVIFVDI
ncbi:uncharacterized protein [Chironomus tepperi]|uniref:uncharacterized protein n=1 Tax=Chironomus tepperi TaxID=113505 RepID=UPI00391F7EE2